MSEQHPPRYAGRMFPTPVDHGIAREDRSTSYPPHMMAAGFATQSIPYQPATLAALVKTLPPSERAFTIGYDSSSPDNQLVANLISAELS